MSTTRAMNWSIRDRTLSFDSQPLVMGILNVTPDSFYDGGRLSVPSAAIEKGCRMVDQGASILDIGGESTRPGAHEVSTDLELGRVLPVVTGLRKLLSTVPLSIDTRHAEVARMAMEAGADIINDISALRHDPAMSDVVVSTGAGLVLMHMKGQPETMQNDPQYEHVVQEVREFLGSRIEAAVSLGIRREALVIDPGIGFGKTVEHNLDLIAGLDDLLGYGRPVLVGMSRKSFLGAITGRKQEDRLAAGVAANVLAALHGAVILRVHDVMETCDALKILDMVSQRRP